MSARQCLLQVSILTLGLIPFKTAATFGQQGVTDAVAFAPMVTMLVLRSCEVAEYALVLLQQFSQLRS